MGAAAIPLAVAAIGAGTAVYSAQQQKKAAEEAGNIPKVDVPKLPNTAALATSMEQADIQAKTAGGTILSDQKANNQIGDGNGTGRKALLGT